MPSLTLKPVNNRVSRPAWATNDRELTLHVIGKRIQRNITIARMYWLENHTAQHIANELGLSLGAVKEVLQRLKEDK